MTSHAAVVARGWGKCCVVGAEERQDRRASSSPSATPVVKEGDDTSRSTARPARCLGALELRARTASGVRTILKWADAVRKGKLGVRTNADTPEDAANARELGAEGIGLCRTEHMFFEGDRIPACAR
jgi:pyruvate,orthophosphate dikinase